MKLMFGEKFCSKCGAKIGSESTKSNKTKMISLIVIIVIIIGIVFTIAIKKLNPEKIDNGEELIVDQNTILQIASDFCNKNGYEMDINTEQINEIVEFYKSNPKNFESKIGDFLLEKGWITKQLYEENANIIMPNLVGMNYEDVREYLDQNNLNFIENINYTTDVGVKEGMLPMKIKSTIPSAGEALNPDVDTSIEVYTDYVYYVEYVNIHTGDKNFNSDYFGKTLKIQLGNSDNTIIEGTIGTDFKDEAHSYNNLEFGPIGVSLTRDEVYRNIKKNKVACYKESDIMTKQTDSGQSERYVNIKLWMDDKLIKSYEDFPTRKLYIDL